MRSGPALLLENRAKQDASPTQSALHLIATKGILHGYFGKQGSQVMYTKRPRFASREPSKARCFAYAVGATFDRNERHLAWLFREAGQPGDVSEASPLCFSRTQQSRMLRLRSQHYI